MKTKYKFIYFEKLVITKDSPKPIWLCCNNKTDVQLGKVEWFASWRQYVFVAQSQAVIFSKSCLQDICHFIEQQEQSDD